MAIMSERSGAPAGFHFSIRHAGLRRVRGGRLMSVAYTCPNADCGVTLKTPNPVPPGKKVKCPKCNNQFIPVPVEEPAPVPPPAAATQGPGTFKFADDGSKKPTPAAPPPPPPKPAAEEDEDDESVKKGYGVVKDTEEEIAAAEKNKPKFVAVEDKFKKSARGPAIAMLVSTLR